MIVIEDTAIEDGEIEALADVRLDPFHPSVDLRVCWQFEVC